MSLKNVMLSIALVSGLGAAAHATPEGDKTRAEIKKAFGFTPGFVKVLPDSALPGVWQEISGLQMSPSTALSGKHKELIGLAVASQIPCRYCIYAHTEFAKVNGASQDEVAEAVSLAAHTRKWSAIINGFQPDEAAFRADVDRWIAWFTNPPKDPLPAQTNPIFAEVQAVFGSVPDFVMRLPKAALPGAWRELKDVELDDKTALPGKVKSLIGIAVAAQTPCRLCLIADTKFAKLQGASDEEIGEAIALAALVRQMSTYLNGLQVDEAGWKRDIDRIVREAKKTAGR